MSLLGLSNVGASFCCLMEMCLGDQQYITLLFYLDDICVFNSTIDEMLNRLGLVLSNLKEFNLKIKLKEKYFFQSCVVFLSHVLSKDGISPNLEKVSKVKDWPVLKSTKEVNSFLGLVSYYHRFIPQFAKWANLMHDLILPIMMKKHAGVKVPPLAPNLPPFQWTPEHQESFDKLTEALISAPIFSYPDYSKLFLLETDASLKDLGAVLLQEDDKGNLCVVSYANHMLKPYENSKKNYSSAKLKGSKFTVLMIIIISYMFVLLNLVLHKSIG